MPRQPHQLAAALNQQSDAFKAFLIARVGCKADAEDILQNSLLKAFRHAGEITDPDQTTAWFYRVLRNAIIDLYNALGVPIAAGILYPFFGVLLSPMLAGVAILLSSVSVISNALRLRHTKL